MPTVDYGKRLPRLLEKLDANNDISPGNKETMRSFYRQIVMDNISSARIDKTLNTLIKIAESIDFEFKDATREDIENLVVWISNRRDIAEVTKTDYKKILKRFYRWIGDGEYPKSIAWLKTNGKEKNGKLPEEMLEEEDIQKLLTTANSPRDRAIIALLWETGARMGELIDLRVGSFEDHKHGLKIVVDGKTGQRRLPLIDSVPYVNAWLESHPNRGKKDSPMWVNIGTRNNAQKMEYPAIRKMLKQTAETAGVNKPMHPHHFRHSRATYLANRFTEAQLCAWFGWVLGSDVPGRYVHLSGRDIDTEYARLHGIEEEDRPKESKMTPKPCPRCKQQLPYNAEFCYLCGMTIELKLALEVQEAQQIETEIQQQAVDSIIQGQPIDMELLAEMVAKRISKSKV